ncbi:PPE family protein [Mycobacterium shinjukuense]|uniref:PPE family protein n=1 Tax=Mycobacterium shinjukuense TaxID=398694 RepID=A0A7I7MTM3_9MYCO|nr:PPE family protein [Mycobacterium shinjukuense]MCV6985444.1 PPE family protein [Mycobacterium shinjukuense]ORB61524.1 hypothetical protein BST45_19875 [Mycobacterium shinjukuense]BBX75187.1 PPE family protein [Mycobacterium shinjukuense]
MLWHAMPPELNAARLMAGAGPEPMLVASAGWEALAAALDNQAGELSARLCALSQAWTGDSSERAIAAASPMLAWLRTVAAQAKLRAQRATAQAAAYTEAVSTMPSLPEIAANHVTHVVLTATNFFGINTVPIAFNEMDYFVRMWNQAAQAMDIYQAETAVNTRFDRVEPMPAILAPDAGQTLAAGLAGKFGAMAANAGAIPFGQLPQGVTQALSQVGGMTAPLQQLTAPLQQLTSLFNPTAGMSSAGSGLADDETAQLGLIGASPLSSHPLAGGSGPSMGAGLLRADALPGAAGTLARTPLMAGLIDRPAPAVPAASATATPSPAAGGAVPIGAMGRGAHSGASSKQTPAASPPPTGAHEKNDHELFDDQDDW